MAVSRGKFSSRFGFVMAASGSAVGLGNIWGFPTQTASNGGAAFLFVYLILAFLLAYPVLMAELTIGRYADANSVTAYQAISRNALTRRIGSMVGLYGIIVVSLILSFYAIVAGWMIAFGLDPLFTMLGMSNVSSWLTEFSTGRNITFCFLFMLMTIYIVSKGVQAGIEKWSSRLMPILLFLLFSLIIYVLTQKGGMQGLRVYLVPDFKAITEPKLIISALGQAFFSLSLGVGTMLIYGSYIKKDENLPALGSIVTVVDIGIAFIAGLLIIPAMYVAMENGVEIFAVDGSLLSEDTLLFKVLPALFNTLGDMGLLVALIFFTLMTIAAITSSISMLEVPVVYATERHSLTRQKATVLIACMIFIISLIIIFNFDDLFIFVINLTTRYSQPFLGFALCIYTGWIWHRHLKLKEIKQGFPEVSNSFFWKIWPNYIRFVCPTFIVIVLLQGMGILS